MRSRSGSRRAHAGRPPGARARPRAPRPSAAASARAVVPVQPCLEPPCAAQAEIVRVALEDGDHDVPPPVRLPPSRPPRRARAGGTAAGRARATPRAHRPRRRPAAPPRRARASASASRPPSISAAPSSASSSVMPRCVEGEQLGHPLEQADRRRQVAAGERPPPGRLEPLGTPGRRARRRASRAQPSATRYRNACSRW